MANLKDFAKKLLIPTDWQRGKSRAVQTKQRHEAYRDVWVEEKRERGDWLSKEDYERKTGRPGRK